MKIARRFIAGKAFQVCRMFSRPYGTLMVGFCEPGDESLGYFLLSLRDKAKVSRHESQHNNCSSNPAES